MASGCTHICFVGARTRWPYVKMISYNMLNKHFIKRLFYFVLILAFGAIVSLVVNYIENSSPQSTTGQFDY